jgi:hypothetical protein
LGVAGTIEQMPPRASARIAREAQGVELLPHTCDTDVTIWSL